MSDGSRARDASQVLRLPPPFGVGGSAAGTAQPRIGAVQSLQNREMSCARLVAPAFFENGCHVRFHRYLGALSSVATSLFALPSATYLKTSVCVPSATSHERGRR